MQKIIVSWLPSKKKYRAHLEGFPEVQGFGEINYIAVGNMVASNMAHFGHKIVTRIEGNRGYAQIEGNSAIKGEFHNSTDGAIGCMFYLHAQLLDVEIILGNDRFTKEHFSTSR